MALFGSRAAKKSVEHRREQRAIALDKTGRKLELEGATRDEIDRAKKLQYENYAVSSNDRAKENLQKQLAKNGDALVAAGAVVTTVVGAVFPPAGAVCLAGNTALAVTVQKQKQDFQGKLDEKSEFLALMEKDTRESLRDPASMQDSEKIITTETSPNAIPARGWKLWLEKLRIFATVVKSEIKGIVK
jgi:hypothetical protein